MPEYVILYSNSKGEKATENLTARDDREALSISRREILRLQYQGCTITGTFKKLDPAD